MNRHEAKREKKKEEAIRLPLAAEVSLREMLSHLQNEIFELHNERIETKLFFDRHGKINLLIKEV